MADNVTPWILDAMEEARNLLYCDDSKLTLTATDGEVLLTLNCGWSLIPPQARDQDNQSWVLRLRPQRDITEALMDRLAFAIVEDRKYEREWGNPLRRISSVWILSMRQTGTTSAWP
jgi:hypothetical protein